MMLRRKLVFTSGLKDSREVVEDDEGCERPTTSKNNKKIDFVRNLVKEDLN